MSVNRDNAGDISNNISVAWKCFNSGMRDSKYLWGGKQYLEEHLGFSETDNHLGGIDLYISIADSPKIDNVEKIKEVISACRVAIFRTEGTDGEKKQKQGMPSINGWKNGFLKIGVSLVRR